jgi:carboxymethylenebutenolidase
MIQSQISFESGGKDIRLDCYLPETNGKLPTVIALYGSGGDHLGMSGPAGQLAERGFAVYVLHYFDRTGAVEIEKSALVRHFPVWMKTLWDAVGFVEQQASVDPSRIGLIGFSLGGYLAVCGAAIDPRVRAVVEFFGGLPKEMKLFMRRLCPMLILHGENDPIIPVAEAYHLQGVLQRKNIPYEMQIYPGVGHGFDGEAWADAKVRSLGFLRKYLSETNASPVTPGNN